MKVLVLLSLSAFIFTGTLRGEVEEVQEVREKKEQSNKGRDGIALFFAHDVNAASIWFLTKTIDFQKVIHFSDRTLPTAGAIKQNFPQLGGTLPVKGDWDGDGYDTIGLFIPPDPYSLIFTGKQQSVWYLKNSNNPHTDEITTISMNLTNKVFPEFYLNYWPIAGDWNGDGKDTIGLFAETEVHYDSVKERYCCIPNFYLKKENTASTEPEDFIHFNLPMDCDKARTSFCRGYPLVGDWDGDGKDGVGVFYDQFRGQKIGIWVLKNKLESTMEGNIITLGDTSAVVSPLVGDWDGDGVDTIGLYYFVKDEKDIWQFSTNLEAPAEGLIERRMGNLPQRPLPLSGRWQGL